MRVPAPPPGQAGELGTTNRPRACLGVRVDIIEPCGFPWGDRALKRAGMDYAEIANVARHVDWDAFAAALTGRLVLFTTRGTVRLPEARFEPGDILMFGAEGSGVPDHVHARAELSVRIPLRAGLRSLNVAVAAGIGLAEALRQQEAWPSLAGESSIMERHGQF